jgi:hypothetical protein
MSLSPPRLPAARRHRVNGSFRASRALFKKLWRSRVRLTDTLILGADGVIETWLFWSKSARCLLQKAHATRMDGHGHERVLEKFRKGHTPVGPSVHDGVAHVIGPSGRAIFSKQGFRIGIKDAEAQYHVLRLAVAHGGDTIAPTHASIEEQRQTRSKKHRVMGSAVITHYVEPSERCVFVVTIVRNPNRPTNMYEARRMGNTQVDFSFRVVEHHSAYEDIEEAEASAWRLLTRPPKSSAVRPTYTHTQPSNSPDSKTGDFEVFLEFHNAQPKKQVPKSVQNALRRASEDVLSWMSQQHGMWITHIELEYMVETSAKTDHADLLYGKGRQDPHRGKPFLKAANFIEWVPCNTSRPDEQLLPGSTGVSVPMLGSSANLLVSSSSSLVASSLSMPSATRGGRGGISTTAHRSRSSSVISSVSDAPPSSNNDEVGLDENGLDDDDLLEDEAHDPDEDVLNNAMLEATSLKRTTIRGRIQVADAGPRAWSDLMDLQARRPYACTVEEEDLTRELGATHDHLRSVRGSNVKLVRRLRRENETNFKLDSRLKKTRAKMIELGKWRKEGLKKHNFEMKEERALRQSATDAAAIAQAKLAKITEKLRMTQSRLDHHLEQEALRLEEERIAHEESMRHKERERKKLVALGKLENALGIVHKFQLVKKTAAKIKDGIGTGREDQNKGQDAGGGDSDHPDAKLGNDPEVLEQISRLRDIIKNPNAKFGTKLGVLNDLFSAMDSDGSGAVTKLEFQWAMEKAGGGGLFSGKNRTTNKESKKKKSSNIQSQRAGASGAMKLLVDSLDVDGDGEITFMELVDGLMRRRQDAKALHGEHMKRAAKEAEKKAKHKAQRMKVKGY